MFKLLKLISGLLLLLIIADSLSSVRSAPLASEMLAERLSNAAIARTRARVRYDGAYVAISYPLGDVPADTGVCSDVVIRAYRAIGIDLQKRVHEDMRRAFSKYPKRWGLKRTDKNIDHRRVPNLRVFFARHGEKLKISKRGADYRPGDLVTWDLAGREKSSLVQTKLPHIGIVTDRKSADGSRPLIVHNIGAGPKLEDMLFDYKITGHYRYLPKFRQE